MPYLSIAGTEYLVEEGNARMNYVLVENRERMIDGSLAVDRITTKKELSVDISGLAASGTLLTPAEGLTLISTLLAGDVAITGDLGAFTGRARDIGYVDISDRAIWASPVVYRIVSATFDEV